ncbi:MFS transporter [Pilimelia columellifera]|uniref:MFS transporter n=1 Tax=Pilimelia columellifera subsp. columellifera TaxID=706583 RepID=A0ABN3NRG6_9ACTN
MAGDEAEVDRTATFRDVFAVGEYRALFTANALSWAGDYLAKAAVSALVYERTNSAALSAATFALSYLPWLVGGPVLSALADRFPYRKVMIVCDLLRMVTIGVVALPGVPVEAMLVMLFLTSLANPPAQAARSALLPMILDRQKLVVGIALNSTSSQVAQLCGYLAGGALAPFAPRAAIAVDAATFGLSALLIWRGVRRRPAHDRTVRRHLLRETGEGFRLVFGTPVLRAIALLVFATAMFSIVPEGLAAAWAAEIADGDASRGINQGLIMVAAPAGFILGSLTVARAVRPSVRERLVPVFGVLAAASLTPALATPSVGWVLVLSALSGFATAGLLPTANGLFVQALPDGYRARAFGVMQTGLQVFQGVGVLVTGVLADLYPLPKVVGLWSLGGVGLMLIIAATWPTRAQFRRATASVSVVRETGHAPAEPAGRRPRAVAA